MHVTFFRLARPSYTEDVRELSHSTRKNSAWRQSVTPTARGVRPRDLVKPLFLAGSSIKKPKYVYCLLLHPNKHQQFHGTSCNNFLTVSALMDEHMYRNVKNSNGEDVSARCHSKHCATVREPNVTPNQAQRQNHHLRHFLRKIPVSKLPTQGLAEDHFLAGFGIKRLV